MTMVLAGRHEDREVDDAVLLRAHQLVAIDEQHGQVAAVLRLEFRHARGAREFADEEQLAGDGFVERQVGRRLVLAAGPRPADERDDGEVTEGLGGSEIEFFERVSDVQSCSSVTGSHGGVTGRVRSEAQTLSHRGLPVLNRRPKPTFGRVQMR